jgi:hypothetical protein
MWQRIGGVLFFLALGVLIMSQSGLFSPVIGPGAAPVPPPGIEAWMPVLISFVLLFAAVWVILSGRYSDATQKWAFGAAGSILGYWLNTGR